MEDEEVIDLTTEDLLKEFSKLVAPARPEGFGVTTSEVKEENQVSNALYVKGLLKEMDLVCIAMRNNRGQSIHVYAKEASASKYEDWIIDY